MDRHHGDLHKCSACNDFHVKSDIAIWEGGYINGAGSQYGWSELCKKAGGC